MFNLDNIVRENIRKLVPYSSARDEFAASSDGHTMLDANENPFETGLNRYPDPYQKAVKQRLSEIKNVDPQKIFVGNGSDEAIDLLIRAFCEPGKDRILITPPTYGMYKVSADINDAGIAEVPLNGEFQLNVEETLSRAEGCKLIFLCSPINPTGNLLIREDILKIAENFNGIVVVDEAYIDFCEKATLINELKNYPNLVILQTLSKAWGLAGLRLGLAFASEQIIQILNRIKPPYNVNILTQQKVLEVLAQENLKNEQVQFLLSEKERVCEGLKDLSIVEKIYPSDANFLLARFTQAREIFDFLQGKKVIIRDRSTLPGCEGCLRITIGTREENDTLLTELKLYSNG